MPLLFVNLPKQRQSCPHLIQRKTAFTNGEVYPEVFTTYALFCFQVSQCYSSFIARAPIQFCHTRPRGEPRRVADVVVLFSVKSSQQASQQASQPTTLVEILSQYDLSQTLHGEGNEERRKEGKKERRNEGRKEGK